MSVKLRQELERRIASAAIKGILAAGYSISVNDGEEVTLQQSRSKAAILKALFTTDEDWLLVHQEDGKRIGWVRFIYGNDGWDVINDYSVNLESALTQANTLAESYS